jgi:hypothetical protein
MLSLGELFPNLKHLELQETQENFDRYIGLCLRVWQRLNEKPTDQLGFSTLDKVAVEREDRAT